MSKYQDQIEYVRNFLESNPRRKYNLARRVKNRTKNFPLENRQFAVKASLKLINEHDWNLAEGEFLHVGLANRIVDHIIWSKSIETK